VAALVLVTLTLNGSPLGASAGPLQASGSPSPSGGGGGTAPAIQILNPNPGYDPELGNPPRMGADPPKISDRFDGVDSAYHLVALAANAPVDAIVEAAFVVGSNNEVTIGQMSKVAGPTGTYELFWDIPDSLGDQSITIRVRIFQQTGAGFIELAKDEVVADLEHREADPVDEDAFPADETIEITSPSNAGALGFYKGTGGIWRAVLEGSASGAVSEMDAFYTVTPAGKEPVFKQCGHETLFDKPQYHFGIGGDPSQEEPIPFQVPCALETTDLGSAVTAVAMVAEEGDKPDRSDVTLMPENELSQDSADVHTVLPYVQQDAQLTVTVTGAPSGSTPPDTRRVASSNSSGTCLAFVVQVVDHLQKPVEGANVDVHIQGPTDAIQFGNEATSGGETSGAHKIPDKGAHATENAKNCDSNANSGMQGDHNVPGGNDIKHRESSTGSGLTGGGGQALGGQWRFHLWSGVKGFTQITAWVDDEPLPSPTEKRAADDDVLESTEKSATARAQWYPSAPIGEFIPLGDSGPAGTCRKFLFKARAGVEAIPQINVDIHASGPGDALDFCDPGGGSARNAPDEGPHDPEAAGESTDQSTSPTTHHTEGLTDDEGNFTFGIVSPVTGDTRLVGWIDGEPERNNDVQASGEPTGSATMSWASASGDANVNFVNPSLYGALARAKVAKQTDANALYHIVTRVDSPSLAPGVAIQLGTGSAETFVKTKDLGTATQVSGTDTYELSWAVDVADGDYTLRAQIEGTNVVADIPITVNNVQGMDPRDVPDTTLEMTKPLLGQQTSFLRRSTAVEGIASAGAEGIDVFYTKTAANVPLASASWIKCGFLQLDGTGDTPQPFQTSCLLQGSDQATQVTGIAAVTFDCAEPVPGPGCDAASNALPTGRNPGTIDSGDAHRIFGFDANPLLGLTPPENENGVGNCAKFVLQVTDETGQALPGQNVDVHVSGPGDSPSFCNPGDGTASPRRSPDQGGHSAVSGHGDQGAHVSDGADTQHSEGETNSEGRFIFGVVADAAGDSALSAWLDRTEDDVTAADEPIDSSLMHWVSASNCTQIGTARGDVLTGTPDADRICSRGGDDVIKGKAGNDVLLSGRGNDVVRGGGGNDSINASRGKDRAFGDSGNDTLKGAAGRDRLNGGAGSDSCDGGPERDRVRNCESGPRAPSDPRLVRGGVA
jgi:Ca2+-binding RTX toxin-like protein